MLVRLDNLVLHGEEMDAEKNPPVIFGHEGYSNFKSGIAF